MSYIMCAKCYSVESNMVNTIDACNECGSTKWCDPNEHNNEWHQIYNLQFIAAVQQAELEMAKEALEEWDKGKAKEALRIINQDYIRPWRKYVNWLS